MARCTTTLSWMSLSENQLAHPEQKPNKLLPLSRSCQTPPMPPAPDTHHKNTGLTPPERILVLALAPPPWPKSPLRSNLPFPLSSSKLHLHCCHKGAAANTQFRNSASVTWKEMPQGQSNLAVGWSSSNKPPSKTLWWWLEKSSVLSLPESTNLNLVIATAVESPKISHLHWRSNPATAAVACLPCRGSTGSLKGWCLLQSPMVIGETSFTSTTQGPVRFPVFIKGLHQCCYLGSLPSISRSNPLVWEKPLYCFLSHEQFFGNYIFFLESRVLENNWYE